MTHKLNKNAPGNAPKIVVTGGPSGGKTTLIEALQKDLYGQIAVVPEAASILFRGGFPRRLTPTARKFTQRAICFIQRELEDLIAIEHPDVLSVCDRGSLDSVAYWPGTESDFFTSMNMQKSQEILRYTWVIHLDTTSEESFDSNPIRVESHREAIELNLKTKAAWSGHPRRFIIPHADDFLDKISLAKKTIQLILAGKTLDEIQKLTGLLVA